MNRFALITAILVVWVAPVVKAQKIRYIGAQVYERTCASIYCHGPRGAAGAAPTVAGKGLSLERVDQIVREGIPDTAMAGWTRALSAPDLAAVIEYAFSIQG